MMSLGDYEAMFDQMAKMKMNRIMFFHFEVENVTDMAVLWMISHKMVLGSRYLCQYLENIQRFYEGKEYWQKVDWDLLFGTCPFPVHEFDLDVSGGLTGDYEPG